MSVASRLISLAVLAILVGVVFELVKGDGTNPVRYELGNVASPWLIVPLYGGRTMSRPAAGATAGTVLAMVSLVSFYLTLEILTNSLLRIGAHNNHALFVAAGLVAGLVVGAFGSLSVRSRLWWLELCVPAAFILEPLAAFAVRLGDGRSTAHLSVWGLELVAGAVGGVRCIESHRRLSAPRG
jgi:hypothetical protein